MINILGSVIGAVAKPIAQHLKNKGEEKAARHKLKMSELENRARLMADKTKYNAAWEMQSLKSTPRGLKWGSFILFSAPMAYTVVGNMLGAHESVDRMWASFALIPEGWMEMYYVITGGIWGLAVGRDVAGAAIGAMMSKFGKGKKT